MRDFQIKIFLLLSSVEKVFMLFFHKYLINDFIENVDF